jgi:hypothetical protein
VLEIPQDNITECAGYHVIILGPVWGRSYWIEKAMGKHLGKKWRLPWNKSDSSGGRSIVSDEEEAAIEIDASNSEDFTIAQSLGQLVHVVIKAAKSNNSKSVREIVSIDPECIKKRHASVGTPNLGRCGNSPVIVMDEKQKSEKICDKVRINLASENEAANRDNRAQFEPQNFQHTES